MAISQPDTEPSLKKVLGRLDVLALGFGAMIGFGWVVLTGGWLESAGTMGAVTAMVAGGIIMGVVGLTYAELCAAMPKAGGEHNYIMRAMSARPSFIGSWAIIGGYVTIVAFEAVALPRTVQYIFPNLSQIKLWNVAGFDVHLTWALVGSLAAVVITWINIRGVKEAGIVQNFVVLFLLAIGLVMIAGAFVGGDVSNMEPFFNGGMTGFFAVLVVVPFLFIGFDVIPQSAEEVHIPARQIGKLVVVSVILATIWYVMVILTTSSAMPVSELVKTDIATADAVGAMFGSDIMAKVLIAGGIAGILTSWNSLLLGASRLMFSLARSGMLPSWFGKLHSRYGTPYNALLFIGALSFLAGGFRRPEHRAGLHAGGDLLPDPAPPRTGDGPAVAHRGHRSERHADRGGGRCAGRGLVQSLYAGYACPAWSGTVDPLWTVVDHRPGAPFPRTSRNQGRTRRGGTSPRPHAATPSVSSGSGRSRKACLSPPGPPTHMVGLKAPSSNASATPCPPPRRTGTCTAGSTHPGPQAVPRGCPAPRSARPPSPG
jgi:amino acid transporter